jgi:23S rRNA pseudouridine1911/1915/1917 synthase
MVSRNSGKTTISVRTLAPPSTGEAWVWVPFEVDPRFDGYRVDRYLAQRLVAYSRARVQAMLNTSRVMRADHRLKPSTKVHRGDKILIAYPRRPETPLSSDAALPILYEDDQLLVINKPADLLSHPTDKVLNNTVLGILRQSRPDLKKIHLLHRLDRETSGVLALAKTLQAARAWTAAMAVHQIHKEYIALVRGSPAVRQGLIDWPMGREGRGIKVRQWVHVPDAVPASTRYKVLATGRYENEVIAIEFSVVRAWPETGRLHQIRVHLAALGHPILGDVLYTGEGTLYLKMTRNLLSPDERQTLGFSRLALHAERLRFPHPTLRKTLQVKAPWPRDLADFVHRCGIDTL